MSGALTHERFELIEQLGGGGQAETWLVRDREGGPQRVLKRLRLREAWDPKQVELFEREMKVLAQLEHPRIPTLIAHGERDAEDGGGRVVEIVQSHVPGQSLQALLDSGRRFEPEEVRRIGHSLAETLGYLHGLSPPVIHRDVKPGNIVLDPGGEPWLVDFGAVAARPEAHSGSTMIGTADFTPFEQYMGQALPASDVFALGRTLQALLGDAPAPAWLRRVLEGATQKAPEDRPADGRALAEMLVAAPPDRRRFLIGAGAALLAAGVGVSVWRYGKMPGGRRMRPEVAAAELLGAQTRSGGVAKASFDGSVSLFFDGRQVTPHASLGALATSGAAARIAFDGQGTLRRASGQQIAVSAVSPGASSLSHGRMVNENIYLDAQARIWVSSAEGALWRFETGRWAQVALRDEAGLPLSGRPKMLTEDRAGRLWLATQLPGIPAEGGLYLRRDGHWEARSSIRGGVIHLLALRNGGIAALTRAGITTLASDGEERLYPRGERGLDYETVPFFGPLHEDSAGRWWLGVRRGVIVGGPDGEFRRFDGELVYTLSTDAEGRLWVFDKKIRVHDIEDFGV